MLSGISDNVLKVCVNENISETELKYMLDRAAITSAQGHNRRYFDWLFLFNKGVVESMVRAGEASVPDATGDSISLRERDVRAAFRPAR